MSVLSAGYGSGENIFAIKNPFIGAAWSKRLSDVLNAGYASVAPAWSSIMQHTASSTRSDSLCSPAPLLLSAGSGSGEYVFATNNPFMGDPDAEAKGRDLFRRGVLTEAVLALEAAVQADTSNAQAWRLLGTVQVSLANMRVV